MFKISMLSLLLVLISCNAHEPAPKNVSADLVATKYFVKGMTCGGCIFNVKSALKKSNLPIVDQTLEVGEATLEFNKNDYQKKQTDCQVAKSIESHTEFRVFLDKDYHIKACDS